MNTEPSANGLRSKNGERTCRICVLDKRILRKIERERYVEGRGFTYIAKAVLLPLLSPDYPPISRQLLENHFIEHIPESVVQVYRGERGRRDPLPEERDDLVSDVLRDHIENYEVLRRDLRAFEAITEAISYVLEDKNKELPPPSALIPLIEELQNDRKSKEVLIALLMKVADSKKSLIEQCRKLTPVADVLDSLLIKIVNQMGDKWRESLAGAMSALERDLIALIPNGPDAEMIREKIAEGISGIEITILSQAGEDKDAVLLGLTPMIKARFDTYVQE